MSGIDPNIILQAGRPQVQVDNPLDLAQRGMALQRMGFQNQQLQRQMQSDQATRDAYASSLSAGPDGTPTLDRQKFVSALAQTNPMLAYQQSQALTQQDAAKAKAQLEVTKAQREQEASNLGQIIALPPEQKQSAWVALKQKKIAEGLPGAANAPDQYPGDQFLYTSMTSLMGPKDQADLHEKQGEFAQREADRKLQYAQLGNQRQNQSLQQTQSILESARGNPAAAQAEKDIYAANKFESLVNLYGDPNKLNPQQVQLAASEVGKIATGGVPTSHELQGLSQATIPSGLASLAQAAFNHPQGAEAGAFLKAMQDYTTQLKGDAQKVISDKYGRVIESRRGQLGEDNYQNLKAQYLDRFTSSPQASAPPHPLDSQAVQWARSNPSNPLSAQILRANGVSQ